MNYRMVIYILGRMLGIEALILQIPMIVSLIYGENCAQDFMLTGAVLLVLFLILGRKVPENTNIVLQGLFRIL